MASRSVQAFVTRAIVTYLGSAGSRCRNAFLEEHGGPNGNPGERGTARSGFDRALESAKGILVAGEQRDRFVAESCDTRPARRARPVPLKTRGTAGGGWNGSALP